MRFLALTFSLLLIAGFIHAQTFTGTGGAIPDNGITPVNFTITTTGITPSALNAAHGLKSVCVNITHTYDDDLIVVLRSPDGTDLTLISDAGGANNNFSTTCFEQTASNSILSGSAPFNGTYRPVGNIGFINNGQNGNGVWTLRVFDRATGDQGTLNSWSITFANNAPVTSPLTSSNLPIIVINTNNQFIVDDPKITADMGIIYNGPSAINNLSDPFNNYNGKIGIELRGSSSQQFPKKGMGFETRTASGSDTDVSLLGMPAQADWVLYASYSDKSLLNNVLAYKLYRDFGAYAPRTVYAELFLNKQYMGVYVLIEKIKRDANRVDVSKMTTADTVGTGVTGGYIVKIDKTTGTGGAGWNSSIQPPVHPNNQQIFYQYEYPKETDIKTKQKAYIKSFIDSFETALNTGPLYDTAVGWRRYAKDSSFIRFFILNELSKNVDGYRISTYLYKTKITKDNKLYVGPPWDYDLGFHNSNYCDGDKDTGWAYKFGVNSCSTDDHQVPFWWGRFMQDTVFKNKLKCMYSNMRTNVLDTVRLYKYIDSVALQLNASQARNFIAWPILGSYVWPNPSPLPNTYAGEVTELKQFLKRRLQWMDANIPGTCWPAVTPPPTTVSSITGISSASVYPNPFSGELFVEYHAKESSIVSVQLTTVDGRLVSGEELRTQPGKNIIPVAAGKTFPAGLYLLQLRVGNEAKNIKVVKE